ncbi:hypothetical protein M8494_23240 [Serratia ureilytica]
MPCPRLCPGVGGPAARAACSQQPGERAPMAAGQARSRQDAWYVGRRCRRRREVMRCECTRHCTRDDMVAAAPERHARWHDEMHGTMQRIGSHHGRVLQPDRCATPIKQKMR